MSFFNKGSSSNDDIPQDELDKVRSLLDSDETILEYARQARLRPGGSIVTPNSIFATTRRIVIRNPMMLGLRDSAESIFYSDMTDVRIEKGVFAADLIITMPGLAATGRLKINGILPVPGLFKGNQAVQSGMIAGIPKDKAEKIANIIRTKISEHKTQKNTVTIQSTASIADELAKLDNLRKQGIISDLDFDAAKKKLLGI